MATFISGWAPPDGVANLIPTSLILVFQTIIVTVEVSLVKSKIPKSAPCNDSTPAKGCPSARAVNFATVFEVLTPEGSGFAIISNGGLSSFSKTVQVHVFPNSPGSKLIGAFNSEEDSASSISS